MSDLPSNVLEGFEYLCHLDSLDYDSWPMLQDIMTPAPLENNKIGHPPADVVENYGGFDGDNIGLDNITDSNDITEKEHLSPPQRHPMVLEKGLAKNNKSMKRRKKKYCNTDNDHPQLQKQKVLVREQTISPDDQEGTSLDAKKLYHNAKERIRRMKLNASYLALRALLPNYSRSRKKRSWSAPAIVDRVLKYIPDLENEIEALKLKKQNYVIQSGVSSEISDQDKNSELSDGTTVCVNEVKEGDAIIQICTENGATAFTKLLQKMEEERVEISIQSASTLHVCQNRYCYHLHIQTSESSSGENHFEGLRDKEISDVVLYGYCLEIESKLK